MENLNWKKDLKASLEIIENSDFIDGSDYKHYSKIFNLIDINHKELFKKTMTKNTSFFGLLGSSASLFNAICLCFRKIFVFDINALNFHYLFLQIAGILELEYEEYISYFYSLDMDEYFSKKYFDRLKVELPYESLNYWTGLYENYSSTSFHRLMYTGKLDCNDFKIFEKVTIPGNLFLQKSEFYLLKKKLKQITLKICVEDFGRIHDFLKGNHFDYMYFANMHNYIYDNKQGYNYLQKLKEYEDYLSKDGVLQGGFVHFYHFEESPRWYDAVINQFENYGFERKMICHVSERRELQDTVLIKRKEK